MERFLVAAALIISLAAVSASTAKKIPIKAVVVSMFEDGEHTGDAPGEMQFWVERGDFDEKLDFPLGLHDLYYRKDGVLLPAQAGESPMRRRVSWRWGWIRGSTFRKLTGL